jgi:hypothetical protein
MSEYLRVDGLGGMVRVQEGWVQVYDAATAEWVTLGRSFTEDEIIRGRTEDLVEAIMQRLQKEGVRDARTSPITMTGIIRRGFAAALGLGDTE